jgi:predicted flap endonuclease-1-like 5' DNA nuclease
MKNMNSSQMQKEFETLKNNYESAKQAMKQAKKAFKAEYKSLKSRLKPFKLAYKQAELAEHEAKVAYKALLKELKKWGDGDESPEEIDIDTPNTLTEAAPAAEPKRKPGRPATKVKEEVSAGPKRKPGRPATKVKETAAPATESKRKTGRPAAEKPASPGADDLTRITGVGDKVAAMLQRNGINSFAEMAAVSLERYKQLLKENGMSKFRNPSPWAEEAAMLAGIPYTPSPPAAAAEPDQPKRKPGRPATKAKEEVAAGPKRKPGRPATKAKEEVAAEPKRKPGRPATKAKEEVAAEPKRKPGRPATKAKEEVAAELKRKPGRPATKAKEEVATEPKRKPGRPATKAKEEVAAEPKRKPGRPATKVKEEVAAEPKRKPGRPAEAPTTTAVNPDLTSVKGVSDKVAEMLRNNGIKTLADMAQTPLDRYKKLLKDNHMHRFKDPAGWAKEAAALIAMTPSADKPESEAPKKKPGRPLAEHTTSPERLHDDLTKINGIGIKVVAALHANDIRTFRDMANTSVERFKDILKANGMSKFRNPNNWAEEAKKLIV